MAIKNKENNMPFQASIQPVQRKRNGCLTAFLIFTMIINLLVSLYYFTLGSTLPNIPGWAIPLLSLVGLANFAFGYGMWK